MFLQLLHLTAFTIMARQTALFLIIFICLVDQATSFHSFKFQNVSTHISITQTAILQKIAEVCRDVAISEKRTFNLTINGTLSAQDVQNACSSTTSSTTPVSAFNLQTSISSIVVENANMDFDFAWSEGHHFYNEAFRQGREFITEGVAIVKKLINQQMFLAGRKSLGQVLHTLQDFYSHSNWVELGKTVPYSPLIRPDEALTNLAGPNTATCRNCTGEDCTNNILPVVFEQSLLTSGYFKNSPDKPPGKCSHGGPFDQTSTLDPVGGINKDDPESSHGSSYEKAVNLAFAATLELLQDIRLAVGDTAFLQFMGIQQSNVLCFVIDTTGSMGPEIAITKKIATDIINNRKGTNQEPSAYILAPFNDPGFGPVTVTTSATSFIDKLSQLTAHDGGDNPEMTLSGLQLALTAAPPSSEIFVITDAPFKDGQLKNTIIAQMKTTNSIVNFLLTAAPTARRRRRDLTFSDVNVYQELASASGGQVVVLATKSALLSLSNVIQDFSTSAVVTIFNAIRNPGNTETFTFLVDSSLANMIAYITESSSLSFSVTSPTGVSQSSSQPSGSLGSFIKTGNLYRFPLSTANQTGLWKINIVSNSPYSVKVTGQSSLNFNYKLVEKKKDEHDDFVEIQGIPLVDSNISALIFVTGSVKLTEITLTEISGSTFLNGSVQSFGSNIYLATYNGIPNGTFVLLLKGENNFQRQSITQIKPCNIFLMSSPNITNIQPGSTISIPFSVAVTSKGVVNDSANATFTVQVNNDRGFSSTSPNNVTTDVINGGVASGIVTLTIPPNTTSGTDVTLTIVTENTAANEINYSVRKFPVVTKVADVNRPFCEEISTTGNCSSAPCNSSWWVYIATLTDGINGTGIDFRYFSLIQGNGRLSVSYFGGTSYNLTYNASCCATTFEIIAVDLAGNVGGCLKTVGQTVTTPISSTTATTPTNTSTTATTPTNTSTTATTPNNTSTTATTPTNTSTTFTTPNNTSITFTPTNTPISTTNTSSTFATSNITSTAVTIIPLSTIASVTLEMGKTVHLFTIFIYSFPTIVLLLVGSF